MITGQMCKMRFCEWSIYLWSVLDFARLRALLGLLLTFGTLPALVWNLLQRGLQAREDVVVPMNMERATMLSTDCTVDRSMVGHWDGMPKNQSCAEATALFKDPGEGGSNATLEGEKPQPATQPEKPASHHIRRGRAATLPPLPKRSKKTP